MTPDQVTIRVVPGVGEPVQRPVVSSPYLTLVEVAAYLGLPVETLRAWRKRGKFAPAFKLGKLLRWHRDDVARWLEDHREPAGIGAPGRVQSPRNLSHVRRSS